MKKIIRIFKNFTTPAHLTQQDGLEYWQEKVILNLLLAATILGLITYIPSFALSVKENLWVIAVADTALYIFILFLFFKKDLSYKFRATCFCVISYCLGIILITVIGTFSGGPVWLFFFPVITIILLGPKNAYWALFINVLTLSLFGFFIHFHLSGFFIELPFKTWVNMAVTNPLEKWFVSSINFMLLNIIVTLSISTLLKGLLKSLASTAESEKRIQRIFDNVHDLYFEISLEGIVFEVSPSVEKFTQYSQKSLKGQSILNLYEDIALWDMSIKLLIDQGYLRDYEIRLADKNGELRLCSVNARLVKEKESSEKIIGVLRDITYQKAMEKENKKLETRLNQSKKMEAIGLLAGGVAHDLNNILSGIVTYPELLAMDLDDDDPTKKALNTIQASGQRAAMIIQDLLTLARRGVVTKDLINLNDLVINFLETPEYNKILSYHPDITIEKYINAQSPYLEGSSIHLQKTLMNLISNAAEAQPDGGAINIKTKNRYLDTPIKGYDNVKLGAYIVLCIEDFGTGINPEDLQRIFEPFFTKKVMGRSGTGLGMAVVWGTVQDHDGYIDIISDPGKGTIFELYFPVSDPVSEQDRLAKENSKASIDSYKGSGEKILIIDDIKEQRKIASEILKKLGYTTFSVANGKDAVKYLKTNDADLLILDMLMEPGINGLETYRQVIEFKPEQKAIIASGFSKTNLVKEALEIGAGKYLNKPYTIEKLGLAVKNELEKSRC